MTEVRLTPRGRLVLAFLPPLLLLAAAGIVAARNGDAAPAAPVAASSPVPSLRPSPRATPTSSPSASRPASPSSRPSVSRSPRPKRFTGSGDLVVVPGDGPVAGSGRTYRYLVEVEAGLGEDAAAFAAAVERTLADPRGWVAGGRAFQRVGAGPVAFRVTLASPGTTDRLCRPLRTGGIFSCYMGGRAVVNLNRWRHGASAYGGDLAAYRLYVVNHEVGHALGFDHRGCPGAGRPAPVMMQQTKGVGSCRPNPWPSVA